MSDPDRKVELVLDSLYISNLNNTTIKTVYLAFKSCKIDANTRKRDKKQSRFIVEKAKRIAAA